MGWSAKRELAKINYRIHTDAIKTNLIPPNSGELKSNSRMANLIRAVGNAEKTICALKQEIESLKLQLLPKTQ